MASENAPVVPKATPAPSADAFRTTETPPDPGGVLFWSYLLLGFGLLTPWSAFVAAVDYFEAIYSDRDAMRWLNVCYSLPMLLSLVINSCIPFRFHGQNRIALGYLLFAIFVSFVPTIDLLLVTGDDGSDTAYRLLLLSAACIGLSNGLVEGAVLGVTLHLPTQFYQAYSRGIGAAALFVVLLRILLKAGFSDSSRGLRISAGIFFLTSAAICLLCFLVQTRFIARHTVLKSRLTEHLHHEIPLLNAPTRAGSDAARQKRSLIVNVAKALGPSFLSIVLIYTVTTTVFPGVPSDLENAAIGDWYKVLLVLLFSLADFVSRVTPEAYTCTLELPVVAFALGRGLFLPLLFFSVQRFDNPFWIAAIITLVGFTNGYGSLCCYGLGRKLTHQVEEAVLAGNLLTVGLLFGINLGSFGSIAWSKIDNSES